MSSFNIASTTTETGATLFTIGFGSPSTNVEIVTSIESHPALVGVGGKLALVNGPASLPAAFVLAHKLLHVFSGVGIFDPKLNSYVVVSSHGPDYAVGALIPA